MGRYVFYSLPIVRLMNFTESEWTTATEYDSDEAEENARASRERGGVGNYIQQQIAEEKRKIAEIKKEYAGRNITNSSENEKIAVHLRKIVELEKKL